MIAITPQYQTAFSCVWPAWQVHYLVCEPNELEAMHSLAFAVGLKREERFQDKCKLPHYCLKSGEVEGITAKAPVSVMKEKEPLQLLAKRWADAGHVHGPSVAPVAALHGHTPPLMAAAETEVAPRAITFDERPVQITTDGPVREEEPLQAPSWMKIGEKKAAAAKKAARKPKAKVASDTTQLDLFQ